MDNNNSNMIPAVIVAAGMIIASIILSPQIDKVAKGLTTLSEAQTQFVKNNAIDGCYQASRVIKTSEDGSSTEIPETSWLESCMKQKGVK